MSGPPGSISDEGARAPRYAYQDPAAQAWGARLLQIGMERRRRRLAAQMEQPVPQQAEER